MWPLAVKNLVPLFVDGTADLTCEEHDCWLDAGVAIILVHMLHEPVSTMVCTSRCTRLMSNPQLAPGARCLQSSQTLFQVAVPLGITMYMVSDYLTYFILKIPILNNLNLEIK